MNMKTANHNHFHAIQRSRASREIVEQVRDMIAGGHLKAEERLPPERELAQLFGVGRSTLREAVRVLESLGLVAVRPGEGTFLRTGDVPHLRRAFPPEFVHTWTTRLHLFEVRTVLEPELAGLAARRATADQLTKMREVLDAQTAQVQRGATGMEEDVIFHRLIAEATGNPALVQVMDTLSQAFQETRDASLQHKGRALRSLSQNQAILAAIEARNRAPAIRRMRAHIRSLERVLFATGVRPAKSLHAGRSNGDGSPSWSGLPMPGHSRS
jgi:GntR family transcriptional repressor for pyruvate dehydrogenase complex